MNKLLLLCILPVLIGVCQSSLLVAQTPDPGHYPQDWMKKVWPAINQEIPNIPTGCPDLTGRVEQFKTIAALNDLKDSKKIIDSLLNMLPVGTARTIAIVDNYSQGFNFWHCRTFLIYNVQGDLLASLSGCRSDPDPGLVEKMPFILEEVKNRNKDMLNKYLNMKSNCNLDGIFIVTILSPDFEIKKIKVVLMPN